MVETEKKWLHIALPSDGYVSQSDASRLMIEFEAIAQDYLDHFSNATYYKELIKIRRDSAYSAIFINSQLKSDKQKDIEAKSDSSVKIQDLALIEAIAASKYAELKYESAVRSHHAMKTLMKDASQEKYL